MGVAVPDKVLTNQDFEKFLDTSDEWITKRTGIKQRRVCAQDESTADLALTAARGALADAKLEASDLDLIICATITPEMIFPATACFVQSALGAKEVPAFDVSAACSGFVYGLSIGAQFIETGRYKRVLVIGADALSKFCDYTDRGSCILFGDAAGAVVLQPTSEDKGVIHTVLHADGDGWDFIHLPGGGTRHPASEKTLTEGLHYVKMRGRDVYKFAVDRMQWLLEHCMRACDLTVDDIDMVVPHQVNTRIIQSATEKLDFPLEKVYLNIDRYGNTSAASVPLALGEARAEGKVGPGDTLLLIAFGAGLTWAGAVVKL
jgi:3-oxoacyl-[acyl-carrier-protein] synthase-3